MDGQEMQTITMARGSRHLVSVVPGTLVFVRCGAIQARLPTEWPEAIFSPIVWRLDAEETFAATTRGYAEFMAIADSEILIAAPETMGLRLKTAAGALYRMIRSHWEARRSAL